MRKLRIITDSASDTPDLGREDLTILPQGISFGNDQYLDGVTISHREFFEKLIESDTLPVTSLITPDAFEQAYRAAEAAGEEVLVITLSAKLSGTCQSARLAAEGFGDRVAVFDSSNVTIGEQLLVREALRLKDLGCTRAEILAELTRASDQIRVLGLLDTLEYLQKGGRISRGAAFVAGALNIKPVVTVQDGEVRMLGKARGSRNGGNYLVEQIRRDGGVDFSRPYLLAYSGLSDHLLRKYIEDSRALWADQADELPVCTIGATIGTHVGPNAIAVAYFMRANS